jgi:hypothetical protein
VPAGAQGMVDAAFLRGLGRQARVSGKIPHRRRRRPGRHLLHFPHQYSYRSLHPSVPPSPAVVLLDGVACPQGCKEQLSLSHPASPPSEYQQNHRSPTMPRMQSRPCLAISTVADLLDFVNALGAGLQAVRKSLAGNWVPLSFCSEPWRRKTVELFGL